MHDFSQQHLVHLALTQYYRWYLVYEIPFTPARIANQLDILTDDVEVASQAGTMKGKLGLQERLQLFDGWQNAHHVKNTSVVLGENNMLLLEADILYQNIRPDQSRYSYAIHYSTQLQQRENDLPLFSKVNIAPTGSIDPPEFESAYAVNRATSFLYYWLYLLETPGDQTLKRNELLALNFNDDGALRWMNTFLQNKKEGAFSPHQITVQELENQMIQVAVDLEWHSHTEQGDRIETWHQKWVLENNPDERFARMKTMQVL